jgi:predicted metal-dependent hydrolase
MVLVTHNFLVDRTAGALALLRQDGVTGARAGWRLFWFTFGWPGMMRRIIGAWVSYFLPGFHPWNRDDRCLIEAEETALAVSG